ncbi:MAG: flagellar hook capping FlgD N-terminal domain-containing protein [Tepidisphaeraceae bacterium]
MAITATSGSTDTTTRTVSNPKATLKVEDFIKMMVTQLQNQDPMEPAKNEQILQQMSQIGQLQSQTALQDSLKTLVLQNNLGSAGNLIGKVVKGISDVSSDEITGQVTSVKVVNGAVSLELDSGHELSLSKVSEILPASSGTTVAK